MDEQKKIIDSFPEPRDDFDRAYFNYQCNTRGMFPLTRVLLDFSCFFAVLLFVLLFIINRIFYRKKNEKRDAIIICAANRVGQKYSYEGRIPEDLLKEYKNIIELKLDVFPKFTEGVFGINAFKTWLRFFIRHPFSGFINFRCLINIMAVNKLIITYSPKAIIIARAELNNISSIVSCFCELNHIRYINFMHGEMMATMNTAFVRFTNFYIWDKHYIKVLVWGRAPEDQFVVYQPSIYNFHVQKTYAPQYDYTYILCGNEYTGIDETIRSVCDILKKLVGYGYKCKVRPHPRWSDIDELNRVFFGTGIDIENPKEINTEKSISDSKYVIGTFSTVLTEAFYMGIKIIIDDLSDPDLLKNLENSMYFLLDKKHELLSNVISKMEMEKENA